MLVVADDGTADVDADVIVALRPPPPLPRCYPTLLPPLPLAFTTPAGAIGQCPHG